MKTKSHINLLIAIIFFSIVFLPFCSKKDDPIINPPPAIVKTPLANFIASKTSSNEGESIQFTDQSTNTPTSWLWDFGDGSTSTIKNPTHIFVTKGAYSVSLKATNSAGSNTMNKPNYIEVINPEEVGVSDAFVDLSESNGSIDSYTTAGATTISFTGTVPEIVAGAILTVDLDTMGYLRKVVSSSINGNTITVETIQAYLSDIFVDRDFTLNTSLISPQRVLKKSSTNKEISSALTNFDGIHPVEIIYHNRNGNIVRRSAFKSSKADEGSAIEFSTEFSNVSVHGQSGDDAHFFIEDGDFSFESDAVFEFDFDAGSVSNVGDMKSFEFYLDGSAEFASNLGLNLSASSNKEGSKLLYTAEKITAKFMVGIVPLWITINCDVYGAYIIESSETLNTEFGYESDISLKIGGSYDAELDEFTPISEYDEQNIALPLVLNGDVNLDVHFELYPSIEVEFYGHDGPFAEVVSYTEGIYKSGAVSASEKSSNSYTPWHSSVEVGLNYRVGSNLFIFTGEDEVFGPISSECFKESKWKAPHEIELLTTVPEEANAGNILPLSFIVKDIAGDPVEFCTVSFSGDGEISETQVNSNNLGKVSVNWTLQSIAIDNTAYAKIHNAANELIDEVVIKVMGNIINGLATVTTKDISYIGETTATSGGNVTSDGGANITARGVCWSISELPSIADDKTSDGAGTGEFTSSISGLIANTTYYIRAYATNSNGTTYGAQEDFTTLESTALATITSEAASQIASTTAVVGANVTAENGSTVTAKGVCWSTSNMPTTDDENTNDGNGIGSFHSNLTALVEYTTYYYRAYAINSSGTAYSDQKEFTTLREAYLPSVTSNNITEISISSAKGGGDVTDNGNGIISARGVCWSTSENPTIANDTTIDGAGLGVFVSSMTNLGESTTYYVRAYAQNSYGTAYGEQKQFTSLAASTSSPTVTTAAISEITLTTATSGGNVTNDGNANVTAKGVCWSTSENPTIANDTTIDGVGTGVFTSSLIGLNDYTTYYVRAYATNSGSTAYGAQVEFATLSPAVIPTVTATTSITEIGESTAVSGGTISDNGGDFITARGVCWGHFINPTIDDNKSSNGTGIGTFTSNITGLSPLAEYYVRAYATNSIGTAYGPQQNFTTLDYTPPSVVTNSNVTDITKITATAGGEVTADGNRTLTARGVCWSTSPSPSLDDSFTVDGSDIGVFTSSLTGLTENTDYYVRAYATNSEGTNYGDDVSFSTISDIESGSITDTRDSEVYTIVEIGSQIWFSENLRYDTTASWINSTPGLDVSVYGRLYPWEVANVICPSGWHLPSDQEWSDLVTHLGGYQVAGGKLKEAGITHWFSPNTGATNSSGFTALPGGFRNSAGYDGGNVGSVGLWWTSTYEGNNDYKSYYLYNTAANSAQSYNPKDQGLSVRCIKD